MAVCPKCQTPLKEDFGLETCVGCGVVVFVNDDKVSLQEDEDTIEPEAATELEEPMGLESMPFTTAESKIESSFESDTENSFVGGTSFEPLNEPLEGLSSEPSSESELDDPLLFAELSEETEEDVPPPALDHLKHPGHEHLETDLESLFESDLENPESENLNQDEVLSSSSITESDPESDDGTLIPTSADDFLEEMQMFGEMDSEKFQDAIYFFDIEIASIDSKDIRDEILDILDDPKLNLKIDKPNQKIKNGILLLPAVPAVKAFIVVQRISHLPCELSWALVEVHDLGEEAEPEVGTGIVSENDTDFTMDSKDEFS